MSRIKSIEQLEVGDEVKIHNRIYVVMERPHLSIVFERFVAKAQLKPTKTGRKSNVTSCSSRKIRETRTELLLSDYTRSIDGRLACIVGFEIINSTN